MVLYFVDSCLFCLWFWSDLVSLLAHGGFCFGLGGVDFGLFIVRFVGLVTDLVQLPTITWLSVVLDFVFLGGF